MNNFVPKVFFRQVVIFCVTCLSIFLFFSFSSCSLDSLGTQGTSQASTNSDSDDDDDDDDDDEDDRDDPDDCEEDEGDPCKGNESCEQVCESIYDKWSSINSCIGRGDETVENLEEVHDWLMGDKAGADTAEPRSATDVEKALRRFADEDEDVGYDELKCYLQVGSYKYIKQIEKGLRPDNDDSKKRANLIETLKWFVNNTEAAEVLDDLDAGDDIFRALMLSLKDTGVNPVANDNRARACVDHSSIAHHRNNPYDFNHLGGSGTVENRNIIDLDDRELIIYHGKTTPTKGTVTLETTADAKLYSALSCINKDTDDQNIFSFSADKENDHIFKLAFNLLIDICSNVEKPRGHEDKACARAVMCWTAWRDANGGQAHTSAMSHDATGPKEPRSDGDLWDYAEDYADSMEKSSGTKYNKCRIRDFSDFF